MPKKKTTGKDKKIEKEPRSRWTVVMFGVIAAALIVLVAGLAVYTQYLKKYEDKFYPGVSVAGYDLTGLSYLEAVDLLEEPAAILQIQGVLAEFLDAVDAEEGTNALRLPSVLIPTDASGNELQIYDVDFQRALDAAFGIGRDADFAQNVKDQVTASLYGRELPIDYSFERDFILGILEDQFSPFEEPATNATIQISAAGEPELIEETTGTAFDFEEVLDQLEDQIRSLDTTDVVLALRTDEPTVVSSDIQSNIDTVNAYLDAAPVPVQWEEQEWKLDREEVSSVLTFLDGELSVGAVELEEVLQDVVEDLEVDATEARWKIEKNEDGTVAGFSELTESKDGLAVDFDALSADVVQWLADNHKSPDDSEPVLVSVITESPKHTPDNIADLGIKDLLGTGHSNMSGSPVNRRGNIDRGIELLNGLLIAPGEELSLVEALKPFTLDNGYVAELVIKGNETVPEIGGGLCQIGTTTFRGAMESGLNIVQRRNHSYAVSYYSDDRNGLPGTDATIYDSQPDFVFENDTPGYILMQTRRDGNDLYFDYWGTSDGRDAYFTEPVAYNWISPPPTKEVETDTLAPGVRKCTESAHRGVTTDFDYIVNYADGEQHSENFHSVYKPWQAVCLVGVDPNAESEEEPAEDIAEEEVVEEPEPEPEPTTEKKKKKKT